MPPAGARTAYHLVPLAVWFAAPADAGYVPPAFADDGFVHLTHRMSDLVAVANAFYRGDPRPHLVLTVVLARLSSPWRYDGDERYPHVYGPIDRAAITQVRRMPRAADGTFRPIEPPTVRLLDLPPVG